MTNISLQLKKTLQDILTKCETTVGQPDDETFYKSVVKDIEDIIKGQLTNFDQVIDKLELEILACRNAKEELYNILFPNEPEEEREVRWKWIFSEIMDLQEERKGDARRIG